MRTPCLRYCGERVIRFGRCNHHVTEKKERENSWDSYRHHATPTSCRSRIARDRATAIEHTRVFDKRTNRKHLNRGTRDRLRTRIRGNAVNPRIGARTRRDHSDLQIILVRLCRAGDRQAQARTLANPSDNPRNSTSATEAGDPCASARSSFAADGSQKIAKSLCRGRRLSLSEASSFVSFARN